MTIFHKLDNLSYIAYCFSLDTTLFPKATYRFFYSLIVFLRTQCLHGVSSSTTGDHWLIHHHSRDSPLAGLQLHAAAFTTALHSDLPTHTPYLSGL